jgi:2-methylcitrate dehydratase PrpD
MTKLGDSPETPFAVRLARHVLGFSAENATALARAQAIRSMVDTIGVTLAGVPEPCTQILLKTPGIANAPGGSVVFGTDQKRSALDAALINGTASHALDYDDFSGVLGGHQTVPLLTPLLAIGEERHASGEQVLLAYMVGVEAIIKLARAVNYHHYDKGWHPTTTLGVIGLAAAASHLLKLDERKTATALAMSTSLASGLKANFGTMTKPLHVGHCGRDGLMAVLLAEQGFNANLNAFEHHQGFFNVFNGPGLYDAKKVFEGWATPLELEHESIALKQFPCCGSTHPAIMMMLQLVKEERITAAHVRNIEVMPHRRRLRHTNTPHPTTSLEAKFSVQYGVVRALLDGVLRLKHFEGTAHAEPEVVRLLGVTEARPHPDMADDAPEQWGAEVIVHTKDGRRLSRRIDNLVGRGGDNPMNQSELWEKFSDCGARALPEAQLKPLFEQLGKFESVADVGEITRLAAVR